MFKDFDISSFKKMKPPGDNSFDTDQEIKALMIKTLLLSL